MSTVNKCKARFLASQKRKIKNLPLKKGDSGAKNGDFIRQVGVNAPFSLLAQRLSAENDVRIAKIIIGVGVINDGVVAT